MKKIPNIVVFGLLALVVAILGPACDRRPDAKAMLEQGMTYASTGQWDEAIRDFDEAIRLEPTNAFAYGIRGTAYYSKRDFDRAIRDFDQALRLDPREVKAYTSRAYAACGKGDFSQALKDFDTVIRLSPAGFHGYNALAWFLATCPTASVRDGKRAVGLARKACELSGWKQWRCVGTLAAACAEAGDFQGAVNYQQQALAMGGLSAQDAAAAKRRLDLYQRRQPYHESPKR